MILGKVRQLLSRRNVVTQNEMSSFPSIAASSEPGLFDEPIQITLKGLPARKIVTIYASTSATKDCVYESFANYKTCQNGTVDVSKDSSLLGTYTGVEPMGLLWSMIPYADSKKKLTRLIKLDVTKPQIYNLQVFDEEKQSLEECRNTKKTKILTSVLLNRWFMSPGVRRIPVRENGIIATLFLPPGDGPFPGIINMFGGYPGLLEYKSALHATHGFASLALAYIGMDHLPGHMLEKIDLEYFDKVVQYMKNHPDVEGDNGIGVFSICKGAQIGIMMGTYLKDVRCVVSINGNCMGGCGPFKYKDRHFDFDPVDYEKILPDQENHLAYLVDLPQPGIIETVQDFWPFHKSRHVSYMIVAGLSDTCMPSRFMVGEMERLLLEENHPDFEILKYADTGHLIEPPNTPFLDAFYQPGPKFDTFLTSGGKREPHCKSQYDSWPKMLKFMKQRLATKRGNLLAKL